MSRVTTPDTAKHFVSVLKQDTALKTFFESGTVQIGTIIPEPVPREFIFYRVSSVPTQLPGKRNCFDTNMIDVHILTTVSAEVAGRLFQRVFAILEPPNLAGPGTIVSSLDGTSETYVSRFKIGDHQTYADQRNNTPVYGYQIAVSVIAYDWA